MLSSVPGVVGCAALSFPSSLPHCTLSGLTSHVLYLWDQVGSDCAVPFLPLAFLFR